jgi:SAM-dependent methyltransferase
MSQSEISLLGRASPVAPEPSSYVDWKQWSTDDFAKFSLLEGAFFDAEVTPLFPPSTARVLELGFGNGPFLGWCKLRSVEYYGVEIDSSMRTRAELAQATVTDSIYDPLWDSMTGTFDLVAAFDVIEHIEQSQLEGVFARIGELLKQGGCFIAKFPNGDSPFGRVNQHGDLTHVTTIGRGKIEHLASLAKLKVVSIRDPKRPWKNVGIRNAVRRLIGGVAKSALEGLIRTLYFGGESVCFDRNTVAVLRK